MKNRFGKRINMVAGKMPGILCKQLVSDWLSLIRMLSPWSIYFLLFLYYRIDTDYNALDTLTQTFFKFVSIVFIPECSFVQITHWRYWILIYRFTQQIWWQWNTSIDIEKGVKLVVHSILPKYTFQLCLSNRFCCSHRHYKLIIRSNNKNI